MIRSNLSSFAKQLTGVTLPQIYKRIGSSIKEEIEDAFDDLLEETAQYSGATVASYRVGVGPSVPDVYIDDMPKPANANEAFQRGDQAAINLARAANAGSLPADDLYVKLRTGDITVKNGSPYWNRVEEGPLRPVNEASVGALKRFEERIGDKIIEVNLGDL